MLKNGFNVGDRVYYICDFGEFKGMPKYGNVIKENNDPDLVWALWDRANGIQSRGHMPTGRVFLDKTVNLEIMESANPVPFVFIMEDNGHTIEVTSHTSLEDANKRCLELRLKYKTKNIFSYVRVEK